MDEQHLKHIIEALLFAADESLRTSRIREIVGVEDGKAVRRIVEGLQREYADGGRGIQIEEVAGGFRMLSGRDYAEWVEQLRKREKSTKLSQAALETLAIIAYKQPIHRADIENIRGVSVDSIVRGLQERGLIRITGRAEILGRPFLYGTTRRFLEVFGLKSLKDLPDVEELQIPMNRLPQFSLRCGDGTLVLGERTLVMGIVNVTPDSFSDGGEFLDAGRAIAHGVNLVAEGADILDIGGELTRPGAPEVDAESECARVMPVIRGLAEAVDIPISIDTSKALVAGRALAAGATILNDVTAMRGDGDMAHVAADSGAPVVLMHMQGSPRTMQQDPHYDDLLGEVTDFLQDAIDDAVKAGVEREQILIDPGIGFGKTLEHNLTLMRRLGELAELGRPILLGTSRKSLIGGVLGVPADERVFGTAATVAYGIAQGAHIVRVHDVAAMCHVARMTDAMVRG